MLYDKQVPVTAPSLGLGAGPGHAASGRHISEKQLFSAPKKGSEHLCSTWGTKLKAIPQYTEATASSFPYLQPGALGEQEELLGRIQIISWIQFPVLVWEWAGGKAGNGATRQRTSAASSLTAPPHPHPGSISWPRLVVDAPSLKTFQAMLHRALSNLV